MVAVRTEIGAETQAQSAPHSPTSTIPKSNVWDAIKYVYDTLVAALATAVATGPLDNALLRANGTGGATLQGSDTILDDSENLTGIGNITGKAGGIALTGGTGSGDDLALRSTSHATKGTIRLGDATTGLFFDETTGRLSLGQDEHTMTVNGVVYGGQLMPHTESATEVGLGCHVHTNTAAWGATIHGARTRGTDAAETAVQADDLLMMLAAVGHDGTDYALSSQILFEVDGTPGANDMPGRIRFLVSPDGAQTPAESFRIQSTGHLLFAVGVNLTLQGGSTSTTAHTVWIHESQFVGAQDNNNKFGVRHYGTTINDGGVPASYDLDIWRMGMNPDSEGTGGKYRACWQWESQFRQDSTAPLGFELHLQCKPEGTISEKRPFTFFLPLDGVGGAPSGLPGCAFQIDYLDLKTNAGASRVHFDFSGLTISLYNSMVVQQEVNNLSWLRQKNAAGAAYLNLPYFNASDRLQYSMGDLVGDDVTGSSAAKTLAITQVWNTTGTPTALDVNVSDTASAAASKYLNLRYAGNDRFVIDKTGKIISATVSHANLTTLPGWGNGPLFGGAVNSQSDHAFDFLGYGAGVYGAAINCYRTRHATGGVTSVNNGDEMLELNAWGADGAAYQLAAQLLCRVDGTPGANDMPGRWEFYTTPDGSITPALALTIKSTKALIAQDSITSVSPTAGVGYSTGAGGAVTQITSRTTGVTLNTVTGAITLVSAAGSTVAATFTVTNSAVAATDVVKVAQKSGTDLYEIFVTAVAAGSFNITFFTTGGTATEQPVFNFVVIKGAAS